MSFQYDNDDLGYESGYDLVTHSSTNQNLSHSQSSFKNENDSSNVTYQCQVTETCGDPKVQKAYEEAKKAQEEATRLLGEQKKEVEHSKNDPNEIEKLGQARTELAQAQSKLAAAKLEYDKCVKKPQATKGEAKPEATAKGEAASKPAAKSDEGSTAAAKRAAEANIHGTRAQALTKGSSILAQLNKNTKGAGWVGPRSGTPDEVKAQGGKELLVFEHKTGGAVDDKLIYRGNKESGSDQWVKQGAKGGSAQEVAAKQAQVAETEKTAQAALAGKKTKGDIKKALEEKGWTVDEKEIDEKAGTVSATHKGDKFKFKITDKGVETITKPHPKGAGPKAPDYSPEKVDNGRLKNEWGGNGKVFDRWWRFRVEPELRKGKKFEVVQKQVVAELESYKASHSGKGAADFVRDRVAVYNLGQIRSKFSASDAQKIFADRGYEYTPGPMGGPLGRKQANGTVVPFTDADVEQLEKLSAEVQSKDPAKFKEDNARYVAVHKYIDGVSPEFQDDARVALERAGYMKDGEPTDFKVEDFEKGVKPGSIERVRGFQRDLQGFQRDFAALQRDSKKDPEKMRELADRFSKRIDDEIDRAEKGDDTLTVAYFKQKKADVALTRLHGPLARQFGEDKARAIEYFLGFRDSLQGERASSKVDPSEIEAKATELENNLNEKGAMPEFLVAQYATEAFESARDKQHFQGDLENLGLTNTEMASYMLKKGYLGAEDKLIKGDALVRMAKDSEKIRNAQKTGGTAVSNLAQEFRKAGEGVKLPESGTTPEGDQAIMIANQAETPSEEAPAKKGKKGGKSLEERKFAEDKKRNRERADNDKKRADAETSNASVNREKLKLDRDAEKFKRWEASRRFEEERKGRELQKFLKLKEIASNETQATLTREANREQAMGQALMTAVQGWISFVGQLIGAMISSNVQLQASVYQADRAPRGRM